MHACTYACMVPRRVRPPWALSSSASFPCLLLHVIGYHPKLIDHLIQVLDTLFSVEISLHWICSQRQQHLSLWLTDHVWMWFYSYYKPNISPFEGWIIVLGSSIRYPMISLYCSHPEKAFFSCGKIRTNVIGGRCHTVVSYCSKTSSSTYHIDVYESHLLSLQFQSVKSVPYVKS